jgi:hypothetical protein
VTDDAQGVLECEAEDVPGDDAQGIPECEANDVPGDDAQGLLGDNRYASNIPPVSVIQINHIARVISDWLQRLLCFPWQGQPCSIYRVGREVHRKVVQLTHAHARHHAE